MKPISFFDTTITPDAISLVNEVLRSGRISAGDKAAHFEASLSEQLGIIHPVSVNSGTSALHLALAVAGIGPGDEVILPAQTFIATGFAILMQGATPVFADIELQTGNLDPIDFKSKISDRTRAVIPVHWAGYPCDLQEINKIAAENNIVVIEDAAHALGASYRSMPIGSISAFTAFSFQAIKHLTTGDGGLLACRSFSDAKQARKLRWFDIDRDEALPGVLGEREYDADQLGFKYHMNDLAAAVGLGNLPSLPGRLARHKRVAVQYREGLKDVAGITLLKNSDDRESAYWLFTMLVQEREALIHKLREHHVPSSVVHLGIDKNSVFGGYAQLPQQRQFDQLQLSIPIHSNLDDEQVHHIISAIRSGW